MINKLLFAGAALSLSVFAMAPAFAQMSGSMDKMECSEAGMKDAKGDMMKMSDGDKKEMAMKEMKMAEDMMMKKDEKGCMMHMEKAMDMMK